MNDRDASPQHRSINDECGSENVKKTTDWTVESAFVNCFMSCNGFQIRYYSFRVIPLRNSENLAHVQQHLIITIKLKH